MINDKRRGCHGSKDVWSKGVRSGYERRGELGACDPGKQND